MFSFYQLKTMFQLAFLSATCIYLQSCTFVQLREEVKYAEQATVLVGHVSDPLYAGDSPVVVAAYSKKDNDIKIIHYTTLHEPGPYELMVPAGTHNIIAFIDKNRDLTFDNGEPAGQILSHELISTSTGGVVGDLDIVISEQDIKKIDFPVGSKLPHKEYSGFNSTCPGAIVNIEDKLFSEKYARKGFWTPLEFYKEIGGNIYFLEKYDPDKVPVLFVHGASGSPQNWLTILKNIDRTKYQPWFFYYPSGASIDSMSYLLFWKLYNLQAKYKFKELYFTAHSMGGLVVRSFLVNHGQHFPVITNFVSISTPWGGEELADMGVKYSPAVIPAWRDMQPGSEFIESIYRRKMPSTVNHYLFFGIKGNHNILRPNNDKVVTLASQLDPRSQNDATMVYGFNEDHLSILSSQQVISQYNVILDDIYRKTSATEKQSGNRLVVDFTFDLPVNSPRPMPLLFLRPVGKKGSETLIQLNTEDSGKEHGPFPKGEYEVSIIAPAFTPEPVSHIISIETKKVVNIDFLLKPAGFLSGYVIKSDPGYIQAGKYRERDTGIEIQSVSLKGGGDRRILVPSNSQKGEAYDSIMPIREEQIRYAEYYLSGTDFISNGFFCFFNLNPGEYELTIIAKGYKKFFRKYIVERGQYKNSILVELEK
jgi:pimeloyl-ACP methyl ester carboxylesterase